ncbi:MAG TPA: HEAT repeat domain-containing protein [Edaphobacter sp.]|nr:HEAT repeat domain-containing protein [Edaphobacter sp.]
MKAISIIPVALVAAVFTAPAAFSLQPLSFGAIDPVMTPAIDQRGNEYAEGTRAINEGRWSDAETTFTKIASQGGDRADAAMYWTAYAQNKEGQQAKALETCTDLGHKYPQSRWINECGALRIEIQGRSGQPVSPQANGDDELKLLALNALMQQDSAKAMPAIQQILNGKGSEKLKERALFVLASSNSPEAQKLIGDIARGQANPELQVRAVKMYAAIKGKQSVATLSDVYQHTSNETVKRAILQSYLISGSQDKLLEAARAEQNPMLSKAAIQELGAMAAVSALTQLYHDTRDNQIKSSILGSLVASGPRGMDALSEIAKTEQDPELRRKAIRNLGIAGGASAAPELLKAYQSSSDLESKRSAVEGLFLSGDAHDLVALARAEKNPELKQMIVSRLSVMHSKEASDYMMEILNK